MPVETHTEALKAWIDALGGDYVVLDRGVIAAAEAATFASTQKIPLILRPGTTAEVRECVEIANRHGEPLYPVSTGKNWGYGSSVPVSDATLLDLSRLNNIVDYDESLGYVTIEPGVTQRQLFEFLQASNSSLWMDATGSTPDSSLIGNIMERGFGHTPYGDRFANVCALQVVLPDGEIIETGFGRFGSAPAAPVYRWGVGPVLDGLFSQSNFGIVTRLTLWLMPKPEYFQAFFFSSEQLGPAIDALRPLRMSGAIRSAVHVANDYRVFAGIRQYPWDRTGGETPLPDDVRLELRRELQIDAWSGSGALYGTRAQVKATRDIVRKGLSPVASKIQFVDEAKLDLASRFAKLYQLFTGWNLSRTVSLARPVLGLMKGCPTTQALTSTYWRKRNAPSNPDPQRDNCGLIWCSPVAPMTGGHAEQVSALATRVVTSYGFEPMQSISLVTERSLSCVISITYDREVIGEDRRAMECYDHLLGELLRAGYFPYRLGIQSMRWLTDESATAKFLSKLKQTIDPNQILAPGRYVPDAGVTNAKRATR